MDFAEYKCCLERLPYGKRLPTALYLYRGETTDYGPQLGALVAQLVERCGIPAEFNLVKFRTDELKVSFLSYPDFFSDPHPALRHAITVDLATGRARHMDYANNINPPILHRKETFLPPDHPRHQEFASLSQTEEAEGLYAETSTIGFKLNWDRLVTSKNLLFEGHTLKRLEMLKRPASAKATPSLIQRHKTALTRYDLSKPVKSLLEYALLRPTTTFFDYGCGPGSDVEGLRALGYSVAGWDPVFHPNVPKAKAEVVNLGYVLNVIEDSAERLEALVDAYRYAEKLLVVSAQIQQTTDEAPASRFRDGVLTSRNTFQKFFEQRELQQYIEDALDATAVPIAIGIFFIFRDLVAQQDFLSARRRRVIDWTQISSRLRLRQPRVRIDRYEQNKELLDAFWTLLLQLGRLPLPEEFTRWEELREKLNSAKRALRLFINRGGNEAWQFAREERRNDLLVYLALANLRKKVLFKHLSTSLKMDMRAFFGNYRKGLAMGKELLFAAGDPGEIELACEGTKLGLQDEQALFIHRSLLEKLPPLLRVYVGCASSLYGDVNQADVIKLHRASGKVTFLKYDDFEIKPLPKLLQRIKVNLRTRFVEVFDHSTSEQLLPSKERFLNMS